MLFLCAFKDITKEKFHAQQRQLHDRQLALAAHQNAVQAGGGAVDSTSGDHHNGEPNFHPDKQHHHEQQHVASEANSVDGHTNLSELTNFGHRREASDGQATSSLLQVNFKDSQAADSTDLHQASGDAQVAFNNRLNYGSASNTNLQDDLTDEKALISMDEFGIEEGDDSEEDHDKQTTNQYSRRRSRAVLYQLSGHYGGGGGNPRAVGMKSKLKLNANVSSKLLIDILELLFVSPSHPLLYTF